ncbi:MAG: hypothetical protein HFH62_08550 [Lachnospiraceae bacterium]|nr:hypothetical protein [Lachnospiraceae bacterium]
MGGRYVEEYGKVVEEIAKNQEQDAIGREEEIAEMAEIVGAEDNGERKGIGYE